MSSHKECQSCNFLRAKRDELVFENIQLKQVMEAKEKEIDFLKALVSDLHKKIDNNRLAGRRHERE